MCDVMPEGILRLQLLSRRLGGLVTEQAINAAPVVFVVDDDADVREGLRALLDTVGLRCVRVRFR